ncbi:MAG: ribbon-helix-helix protein, CopG family [Deltaproteobacteria bacterium]
MKTAISVPDAVFDEAERLARKLGKSRSELYRDALSEYVARHEPARVTEALDALYGEPVSEEEDAFGRAAARRTLERSEW